MGRRPNTMLQIRFEDDEAGTFFWKLAQEQGVTPDQFDADDGSARPSFDIKIGKNSFSFQLYNGEENYEHGIVASGDEGHCQTIGYDYVTSDWQETIDVEPLLQDILAAQKWADHAASRLGTTFKVTIGANFY